MKVGLICPVPHLNEFGKGPFHLVLAHIAQEYPEYMKHYQAQAKEGSYIVLDNSAHEMGSGGDPDALLEIGLKMGVSELVCPDMLESDTGTLDLTTKALAFLKKKQAKLDQKNIRLMMVPQAPSVYLWGKNLQDLVRAYRAEFKDRPFTIGISKDYEIWEGGLGSLIQLYVEPLFREGGVQVHLLGWGRNLSELSSLSARFPWIRSTDSAKPFVYAYHGVRLNLDHSPIYPRRPDGYFKKTLNEDQLELAYHNVHIFKTRARWSPEYAHPLQQP